MNHTQVGLKSCSLLTAGPFQAQRERHCETLCCDTDTIRCVCSCIVHFAPTTQHHLLLSQHKRHGLLLSSSTTTTATEQCGYCKSVELLPIQAHAAAAHNRQQQRAADQMLEQIDAAQLQLPVQLRINIMPPSLQQEQAASSSMQAQQQEQQQWGRDGSMQQLPAQHQHAHTQMGWGGLEPQQQQQQQLHSFQPQLEQQQSGHTTDAGVYVTPLHNSSQQRSRMQSTPPAAVWASASPCSAPGHSYSGTPPAAQSPLSAPPPGMYNWPAGFFSPASCWSVPTVEQFAAMSAAAAAHSTVSCGSGGVGVVNVVKKYKRAKALLQVCAVLCCVVLC